MRIFIRGFWGEKDPNIRPNRRVARGFVFPVALLLFFNVLLGVGAEWFYPSIESIGEYLMNPEIYMDTVLKE